jgi:hypothetical protein
MHRVNGGDLQSRREAATGQPLSLTLMLSHPAACRRHGALSQRGGETTGLTPIPNWRVDLHRSRTTVERSRRSWRSARASEPRDDQPTRQIAREPLQARPLRPSSDLMVSGPRCGRSSCPPAGSAEGAAQRRELNSWFADQPAYELDIQVPRHHGHARPIGQPNKRPDAGGSLCDVCACVAHYGPQPCGQVRPR